MDITGPVAGHVLRVAAQVAQAAPSILNTQPWYWRTAAAGLELYADRSRQLLVNDPDGRLLVVSCGTALHHACLALAVMGRSARVRRTPEPARPDLLAVIELGGTHTATIAEQMMYAAITHRPTDRRAYATAAVAPPDTDALVAAAEHAGAHLQLVRDLRAAELVAAGAQGSGIRTLWDALDAPRGPANSGGPADSGAHYAVVFTEGDLLGDWLRAGEALSAVLLTAGATGLATAMVSDVAGTTLIRERTRHMFTGAGYPQMGLRIGYAPAGASAAPRRHSRYAID